MSEMRTGICKYADQELIAEAKRVAEKLERNSVTAIEFRKHSKIDSATAERRFKGWNNFVTAAGLVPYKKNAKEFHRDKVTLRQAVQLLRRDRHKCVKCGASPAKDSLVELTFDHIVPIVRGGKTTLSNLWVLCSKCNRQKGERVDPDLILRAQLHIHKMKLIKEMSEESKTLSQF